MEIKSNKKVYRRWNKKYIFAPIVSGIIYIIFLYSKKFNIEYVDVGSLASISATFAGFLITAISIIIAINNNFTKVFKRSILYKDIRLTFFITILIFIVLTFLFSINVKNFLVEILFFLGLVETLVLVVYLYEISRESTKTP